MLNRLLPFALILGLPACLPARAPLPPAPTTVRVDLIATCKGLPAAGAVLRLNRGPEAFDTQTADGTGWTRFVVPRGLVNSYAQVDAVEGCGAVEHVGLDIAGVDHIAGGAPGPFVIEMPVLPTKAPPLAFPGRLVVDGRRLAASSAPFVFRGITGFRLIDLVSLGQRDAAYRWLDDAQADGFNAVRFFTNLCWYTESPCDRVDLLPDEGRTHLAETLLILRDRGMYGHVVALTGTRGQDFDFQGHARAVAEICAAAENCFFEYANEPYHPTQRDEVQDVEQVAALARDAVRGLGLAWTVGASSEDEAHDPAGAVATRHLRRVQTNPADSIYEMIRRLRELELLSAELRIPFMSGEPIGAGEVDEFGRRSANPEIFYAMGVQCRIFTLACVFHNEDGLMTVPLRPRQRASGQAFVAGSRVVGDDVVLRFENAHTPDRPDLWRDGPVQNFDGRSAVRMYSGTAGNIGVTIALGSNTPRFEWGNGWRPVEVLHESAELKVWRIERTAPFEFPAWTLPSALTPNPRLVSATTYPDLRGEARNEQGKHVRK